MSVVMRQEVERKIISKLIDDALEAGFNIDVNDGEETTLEHSTNREAILAAMFTTDEDWIVLHRGELRGWVRLIYGNDGWDVINDYTTNLPDSIMAGCNAIADHYAG